jgi:hypothetical protein
MQNKGMDRSAAYSGIVGAILFVLSGFLPGQLPPASASAANISAFVSSHAFVLTLSAWLTVPAVAFIIWFALGIFDYLRDPAGRDRPLVQWGFAGAIIWGALMLVGIALEVSAVIRSPGPASAYPTLYAFDVLVFIFGMGAFAAFAFAVAHESRRKKAMPGWLNSLGYLVFIVDLLYTLSIFSTSASMGITGIGVYVAPLLSALWIIVASIVLLGAVSKTST